MTWVYSGTRNLLLAMVMHASFTGWLLVLLPGSSLSQGLFWQALSALAFWGAVAVVLECPRRQSIARRLNGCPEFRGKIKN